MDGLQLGAVLSIASLAVLTLVVITAVLVAVTRRLSVVGWLASVVVLVATLAAVWFLLSPVQVDGQLCMPPAAVDGLLPSDGSVALDDAQGAACITTSRQVAGTWSLVLVAAVVAWVLAVRGAPRRSP